MIQDIKSAYIFSLFQEANDLNLMKRRMWRYLGLSLLMSLLINISKFFELSVIRTSEAISNSISGKCFQKYYIVSDIYRLVLKDRTKDWLDKQVNLNVFF